MRTLRNFVVSGTIAQEDGLTPVVIGNSIKLFLDTEYNTLFPEFVVGKIVKITPVACGSRFAYDIEYDESLLVGGSFLRSEDVVDYIIYVTELENQRVPIVSSLTPPTDTSVIWYDPSDGTVSVWDTDNGVWVTTTTLVVDLSEFPVNAYINSTGGGYITSTGGYYLAA